MSEQNKKVPLNLTVTSKTKEDMQSIADSITDGNKSLLLKLMIDDYKKRLNLNIHINIEDIAGCN